MRAIGTRLFRSPTGLIDTYVQLSGIMDLTIPEQTRAATDITPLDTQDDRTQKESGMIDVGESEFSLLYDSADATQTTLKADFDSGDTLFYKVVYRDGSIDLFKGFVSKLGKEVPKDGSVLRKMAITTSGAPTESNTDTTVT
jgi:hypothetical protein